MTDIPDTDTLKGLLAAATPGPWAVAYASGEINGGASGGYPVISMKQDTYDRATDTVQLDEIDVGNARLIALAPSLAARVIELEAEVANLRDAIHAATDPDFIWGAMDNVFDMDSEIDDLAAAASRAIRAALGDRT